MPLIIPCYKFAQNAQLSRENVQLREIGAEFRGQDFATSLYFSLLAGNLGRKVSARLLPLPSLAVINRYLLLATLESHLIRKAVYTSFETRLLSGPSLSVPGR
jgi:hypothetical protein